MLERQDRINWSTLKAMRQSPKHYLHGLASPREDTEALLLGRYAHCAVYEPHKLAERYVCEPKFHHGWNDDTAIKAGFQGGKQAAAAWAIANVGREVIAADLWGRAHALAAALAADPIAAPLFHTGYSEQLVTWTDQATGIECRGRIDHVNGCLSDLKTARSIEPRQFAAQAVQLGYISQLAYYADGLAANGVVLTEPPVIIAVENVAPHDVIVLELSESDIASGRRIYRQCLDRLKWCRDRNEWPGVAGGQRQGFVMPAWAVPAEEETLMVGGEPMF